MQTFNYVIQERLGIHARPAGVLVKFSSSLQSTLEIKVQDGRAANLKKLFSVMGLGVKCGHRVTVCVEGPDEKKEAEELRDFFKENL